MSSVETWKCTNEEYHADHSAIGHSMKEVFRKSRRLYHDYFVDHSRQQPGSSDAMLIGSALHCYLLDGRETWRDTYICAPEGIDRRTKDGKEAWASFLSRAEGRTVLTDEQFCQVLAMTGGVQSVPMAMSLLNSDGPTEHAVRWQCANLTCKCKFDKLVSDKGLILDLKSARDPSAAAFAKQAAALGYHRQAAWYRWGYREVFGRDAAHVYIVVGSEPPYECFLYELDETAINLGQAQNEDAVSALSECYEFDDWRTEQWGIITRLGLPGWAFYDDNWSL